MARPRVFVSSTYYDLKHLRSALEGFIDGLGFEPVLSEKGNIAYAPDAALDESCYREVGQADLMVLIIGGRYGSERSSTDEKDDDDFYARYDSITREEFRTAERSGVPLYILIERGVYAEYQTFLKNRNSQDVRYAHVDSVNIFRMIDEILSLPRNNPVLAFDRYHEIECWLREQWAGLFQELLRRMSSQEQLRSLAGQVAQLSESNKTLKRYLESVMTQVSPDESKSLIHAESKRLAKIRRYRVIEDNPFVSFVTRTGVDLVDVGESLSKARSISSLFKAIRPLMDSNASTLDRILETREEYAIRDINAARDRLGLKPLRWGARREKPELEEIDGEEEGS
jgi:hypothetical protein